jgi:hypothetical protein
VICALRAELRRQREGSGTPATLASHAVELLRNFGASEPGLPTSFARVVGKVQRRFTRARRLSPLRVAFRTYIIGKMQAQLREDARALH